MDFDVTGVITEYNPFHNGHSWINSAARAQGATHIVNIMSGNFVQRGAPALFPKEVRAQAAIAGGADLVLELPLPFAMTTAQRFANGAISLLGALGCVKTLAFGSECGDITLLQHAAEALEHPALSSHVKAQLAQGITFAKARQNAVASLTDLATAQLLASPNNTLAIEYLAAIRRQKLPINAYTAHRQGTGHHSAIPKAPFASATYLRELLAAHSLDRIEPFVPPEALKLYRAANEKGFLPCREETFYPMILSHLRMMERSAFTTLPDISEGLEARFYNAVRHSATYPALLTCIKTKRYPLSRIRRLVWSAFLGITEHDSQALPPYLRILAMNHRGREILAKAMPTLPLSASLRDLERLGGDCTHFARLEARATDLYCLALPIPQPCGKDYTLRIQSNL